jgi:alpha/beta superfamily hydrolase
VEIITPDGATTCVVLAHPHPDYGGSMHDLIVDSVFRALPTGANVGALRFNFGSSDIDDARRDVLAAIDAVPDGLDVVLCGYSFGADVSLAVDHERVTRWIAIAPPLSIVPVADMAAPSDARPTHLVVAAHDQFNPPDKASASIAGWTNATMEVIDGVDHFFGGSARLVAEAVVRQITLV